MKNIVVAGGGVLGSQIAFQAAYCGFNVKIWLREKCSIDHTKPKLDNLKKVYIDTINKMDTKEGRKLENWAMGISDYDNFDKKECLKKVESAFQNIKFELDMELCLKEADLVIEALAEDIKVKSAFYEKISSLILDKTIIVTNSSTLLPSKLSKFIDKKERFLALHFANSIWKNNTAEVMAHKDTDKKVFDKVMKFAEDIRMVALPVRKEKSGYLLNSMLIPFLFAGLDLYVNGISDPESIDKAWTLGTSSPKGPFEILDVIGLNTAYNIVLMYVKVPSFLAPYNFKGMEKLLKKYIDEGKIGKSSGEGFYKY